MYITDQEHTMQQPPQTQSMPIESAPLQAEPAPPRRIRVFGIFVALFPIVFAIVFTVCGKTMPTPSFIQDEQGLLRVNNDHNARLILFAGVPARENYLGGVPGKVSDFGVGIPSGSHLITAVEVEKYMVFRTNAAAMPVSWSCAAIIGNEPVTLTVDTLYSGPGNVRFHNTTDSFVSLHLVDMLSHGTNTAVLAPQSSRLQALPYRDFDIYPIRLDWVTNADGAAGFTETLLSNAIDIVGVYPEEIPEITIAE
jgi:hypothetical protein